MAKQKMTEGFKKDTVNLALQELIARRKQTEFMELFGKMDPDPDYAYKKGRDQRL